MMQLSRFSSEMDNRPERLVLDWLGLVEYLRAHQRITPCNTPEAPCPGKDCLAKFGPAWSPTEFKDNRRANKNALALHVAVFDLDHLTEAQLDEFIPRLEEQMGLECVLHTTHSSRNGDWCFRLIIPLSRPCTPLEWKRVRAGAIHAHGLTGADPATKDLARLYFLPSTPVGHSPAFEHLNPGGKTLDVDALLATAIPRVVEPAPIIVPALPTPAPHAEPVSLKSLIDRLQGMLRKASTKDETKVLVRRVLDGNPLADEGGRDDALQSITSTLACAVDDTFPSSALLAFLHASVRAMPQGPTDPDWMQVASEKLERNRERIQNERLAEASIKDALNRRMRRESATATPAAVASLDPEDDPEEPYSDAQLEAWAAKHGCSVEQFASRWVIQCGTSYFVFANGRYTRPLIWAEMELQLHKILSRAPVRFEFEDGTPIPIKQVVKNHSTLADQLVASISATESIFDAPNRTFVEAVCSPRTDITPEEDSEVIEYLRVASFNDPERFEQLVNSLLAQISHLHRQASALYLHGETGLGKSLIALALARNWGKYQGPSDLQGAFDSFTDGIARCPLLVADESLPEVKGGIKPALRALLGTSTRELRRKGLPRAMLLGCPRVMILANNDRMFEGDEERNASEVQADLLRMSVIEINPATSVWLKEHGGRALTDRWLENDSILKTLRALELTRVVEPGARFMAAGKNERFARQTVTENKWASAVCAVLATKICANEYGKDQIQLGSGVVRVIADVIAGQKFEDQGPLLAHGLSAQRVGRTLKQMSSGREEREAGRPGRPRRRYHVFDGLLLVEWMERNSVGDPEFVRELLARPHLTVTSQSTGAAPQKPAVAIPKTGEPS